VPASTLTLPTVISSIESRLRSFRRCYLPPFAEAGTV
jgi:hypothetical protein